MKKRNIILTLLLTLAMVCLVGCTITATIEETEAPEIEATQGVVPPTLEPTEAPEPEIPAFCGSWRTVAGAGDGTKFVLEVYINADGSARYLAGPPESEFMVDAKGSWTVADDTITLDLYDTMEGFAWCGTYKWAMESNGLALTHISGDAFLYGTEGTTIVFGRK